MGSLRTFSKRELVFGPLWLCIFGVFRLRVWQQSGQGMCLKVASRYTRGLGVWGKEPKEERGPWSPTKLCLFPLPLWKAQPAPSLQNQNSDSWPFSPWLWHSGTIPAKKCRNTNQLLFLIHSKCSSYGISHFYGKCLNIYLHHTLRQSQLLT